MQANMLVKLLKEVISEIVGLEGAKIVDVLYGKKNINEFIVAKKMGLTINQTRNLLYKLGDKGLVSFIRKKDRKKGGWYTYFWTLDSGKSIVSLKDKIEAKIKELGGQIQSRKAKRFYCIPEINAEYTEEEALEHDFVCPETGEVMQLKDSAELISKLEREIIELNKLLKSINIEKEIIDKKAGQVKQRRLRAEVRAKEKERAKKKKERLREMKKLSKKKKAKPSKKGRKEKKEKKGMLKFLKKLKKSIRR